MPLVEVEVSCPVYDSFRVRQVVGLFDVPLAARASSRFSVEVPGVDEPWTIGLIVGPSGSGKTTIAREAFGKLDVIGFWPEDRAVIDCFGELPIKQITAVLTAVGFSSPRSWIKPYRVLSGGEKFRCDLARALAGGGSETSANGHAAASGRVVVFDEFTSVVDRNVAQMGAAAVSKAIRRGNLLTAASTPEAQHATDSTSTTNENTFINCRFVAVSCHYDIANWLEPDWLVDMATRTCQRRRLWRLSIELDVYRARSGVWPAFAPHHYLSGRLSPAARCYIAMWRANPVAFCATVPTIGRKNHWRISRIVTLPDYQGVGIGVRVAEAVAELYRVEGLRMNVTASHPALLAHCARSPLWKLGRVMKTGSRKTNLIKDYHNSAGRAVVSFEYLGSPQTDRSST